MGKLVGVTEDNGRVVVQSSFPTTCQVGHLSDPPRVFVDVANTDVASRTAAIDNRQGQAVTIRTGQVSPTVTRIVLDLKQDSACKLLTTTAADRLEVALTSVPQGRPVIPPVNSVAQGTGSTKIISNSHILPQQDTGQQPQIQPVPHPGGDTDNGQPARVDPGSGDPATPSSDLKVTAVSFKGDDPAHFLITVSTTGNTPLKDTPLDQPSRLAFDLPGAILDDAVNKFMPVNEAVIKDIRTGIVQQGAQSVARVVVDLGQMLHYVITQRADPLGTTYLIDIDRQGTPKPQLRPIQPNDLTGQIIVVDPGHGADDSGAVGIDKVREKDLNLAIGKKVRDILTAAGATVHMTRETDIKPSVDERPLMAISWHANFFISIHCDDSGPDNSHSGTTVYYHAQNAICKRLAQDISGRVGEVCDIPALGVKSDTIRFQSGFGVLRGSPMPAVLVECGYVNDAADATKLENEQTQQNIAEGIAAGLRDFYADQVTHQ
jgi:N-acetylmuramoyl-L-alanine amidase